MFRKVRWPQWWSLISTWRLPITPFTCGNCTYTMLNLYVICRAWHMVSSIAWSQQYIILYLLPSWTDFASNYMQVTTSQDVNLAARCRRVYAHAHDYHINSISNNRLVLPRHWILVLSTYLFCITPLVFFFFSTGFYISPLYVFFSLKKQDKNMPKLATSIFLKIDIYLVYSPILVSHYFVNEFLIN
jgi:hypothetical protein